MILSFKPKFVQPILSGTKIHTIREDAHGRWHAGRKIHFATGVRTKHYKQFAPVIPCIRVQEIEIEYSLGIVNVYIDYSFFGSIYHHGLDDIYDYNNCLEDLAINDGFDSLESFFTWFNKDFSGKIIHWTDRTYR